MLRFFPKRLSLCHEPISRSYSAAVTHAQTSVGEVKNKSLYYILCERTAAFATEVLKVKIVSVKPGKLTLEMNFNQDLVGNPSPASLHGGVTAAAIDHAAGFACWSTFDSAICSTLNMRIDYLKPLFLSDKSLVLDAYVDHIDDDRDILRVNVECFDQTRKKQVAVGRASFNRYEPKLGVMDYIKPLFEPLWRYKHLNFVGEYFLMGYQRLFMLYHKMSFLLDNRSKKEFSIENSVTRIGVEGKPYTGLTQEEYITEVEKGTIFGDQTLGMRVLSLCPGRLTTVIAYKPCFTGNFVNSCLHGGVAVALVDQTAGMCARSIVKKWNQRVSTVDLSIEYLAPAPCFEHVICDAHVTSHAPECEESLLDELISVDASCWNESRTKLLVAAKLSFNVYEQKTLA